jgi:signal peptidase
MNTALRWLRRLLDLALVLLVVSVLGLVLALNLAPLLGHQLVVIRGGSMEPAIHLGSMTDVSQVRPADLRPGDVVMLKEANGTLVSHRITRIVQQPDGVFVETKGDANDSPDAVNTPASSIVGRVDLAIPGLGYLVYLLTVPIGVVSLLGLAMTLFLAILLLEDLERESVEESELEPYESELARNLDSHPNRESVT